MANFHVEKVVSALPPILVPNTVYVVRVGEGFDLYVTDSTGAVAHRENGLRSTDVEDVPAGTDSILGTDELLVLRGSALETKPVSSLPTSGDGGAVDLPALGLWDWWYQGRIGSTNVAANDIFLGAAITSGTNTTAIPAGSLAGYNHHGVFLRSSTTANGGYRYQTSSLVSDYFGTISHKFRFQFLWRTAFTGRLVRGGYLDTNTSADSTDGAYFEIDGSTCRAKTANNSVRTTHATTITLALDIAYTFDIEVNAAGTEARFRVYGGTDYDTPLMDVTITNNLPTTSARAFGVGLVATESSTTASDIGILYGMGIGTIAGFARAHGVYVPLTAPAAFTAGQWDAQPTLTPGEMEYQIDALPSDGGSPITALEYRVGEGAAIALAGTGIGDRIVTAGWTAGTAANTQVRAVNAINPGPWSDIKNRTPAAAGGSGAVIRSGASFIETSWGLTASPTIPASMVAGDQLLAVVASGQALDTFDVGTWFDITPASWTDRELWISGSFATVPPSLLMTFAGSNLHRVSLFACDGVATGAALGSARTNGPLATPTPFPYTTTAAGSVVVLNMNFIGGSVTGVTSPDADHVWSGPASGGYNHSAAGVRGSAGSYTATISDVPGSSGSEYSWAELGAA